MKPTLKTDIVGCHKNICIHFCTETTEASNYSYTLVIFRQGRIFSSVKFPEKERQNNVKCLLRNLQTSFIVE